MIINNFSLHRPTISFLLLNKIWYRTDSLFCLLETGFVTLLSSAVSEQYHFVSEAKSWREAQSHCRTYYTDLATLHSTDDVNTLTQLGTQNGSAWIGLYDDLNSWKWSIANDSFYGPDETLYRNWATGEPNNYGGNEMCVHMYGQGTWNDITCSNTYPFVCFGMYIFFHSVRFLPYPPHIQDST